jgi:hypothetical protein
MEGMVGRIRSIAGADKKESKPSRAVKVITRNHSRKKKAADRQAFCFSGNAPQSALPRHDPPEVSEGIALPRALGGGFKIRLQNVFGMK